METRRNRLVNRSTNRNAFGRTGRPGQADDERADILLAEIQFVRLRDQLPASLKTLESGMSSFSGIVRAAQRALDPAGVLIDYRNGCLELDDGQRINLSPASIVFYGGIARHTQQGRPECTHRANKTQIGTT